MTRPEPPCSWLIAASLLLAVAAESGTISGIVVDAQSRPASGCTIAAEWELRETFVPLGAFATSDARGTFELALGDDHSTRVLLALDARRAQGGVAIVGDDPAPVRIELSPLVPVRGRIVTARTPQAPSEFSLLLGRKDLHQPLLRIECARTFSLALPAGSYWLLAGGRNLENRTMGFDVREGAAERTLEPIELGPSRLWRMIGKRPPAWNVSDARGAPRSIQLADFRGKWVLIEFWSYGCLPCVRLSLPRLAQLFENYSDRRNGFQILAFHDGTATTLAEADEKLQSMRSDWFERSPFPNLLDATNQTIREWGISSYPTLVLIDPRGVVAAVSTGFRAAPEEDEPEAMLETALEAMAATP